MTKTAPAPPAPGSLPAPDAPLRPARGLKAQAARAYVAALGRMDNPALLPLALAQAEGLVPEGENGLALLHEFAGRAEWPARYLAARLLGERSAGTAAAEAAWPALLRLATDKERWVTEGVSWGLGALLRRDPGRWGPPFLAAFPAEGPADTEQSAAGGEGPGTDVPVEVRRALLFGVVPALRNGPEPAKQVAIEVIDRAAAEESTATRQLGSLIVGRELAQHEPDAALELVERWAASECRPRRWQAARALTPPLRAHDPDRAAAIVRTLEQVPDAAVRSALRGALKDDGTADGEPEDTGERPRQAQSAGSRVTRLARPPAGGQRASAPAPVRWESTAEIEIGDRIIDQVVGQDRAVEIVRLAAQQKRFVLLVGEPGTGKSMLAAAMAEMMGADDLEDVLVVPNPESRITPLVESVPAGEGERAVRDAKKRRGETETAITFLFWTATLAASLIAGWYALATKSAIPGLVAAVVVAVLWGVRRFVRSPSLHPVPKLLVNNARALETDRAPFVDATGFHAGALLGDVRHDPFQSGGYETPPHELVEPGAIHLAHRGVLFIDEVSTLSIESQQSLLTAIQEKRFPISGRTLGSSGTMIRSAPAPCNFLLILAGNMEDVEKMHPALRSRVRGYGYELYMNEDMPDSAANRAAVVRFCAQEVAKDRKIPHLSRAAVEAVIEEARVRAGSRDRLTTRLRELGGLVRAAGDLAAQQGADLVQPEHVAAARENTRTLEEQISTRRRGLQDARPAAREPGEMAAPPAPPAGRAPADDEAA